MLKNDKTAVSNDNTQEATPSKASKQGVRLLEGSKVGLVLYYGTWHFTDRIQQQRKGQKKQHPRTLRKHRISLNENYLLAFCSKLKTWLVAQCLVRPPTNKQRVR